ncbi:hypothetical protein J23TS9_17150 [Paenibacillus sp. J23TS9]|uniref:DnaJ family domain-containing protein n=1 Tax=Paenibacillus sp. J23TS9 TaxID=2807193 RepID=UPI001B078E52|nr:DUF1992 domain-containing protein [Paenibacillus sp. J23TS9]GIP26585.1 hypothetical protein J23TS9_17150 [Paenibacillus sp. J23TS9]
MDLNDNQKEAAPEENQNNKKETNRMSTSGWLLETAVDEFAQNGGFDDLPGKGKPIKIGDGDVLTGIMRNANYQPAWIELRKEIAADLKRITDRSGMNLLMEAELMDAELEHINQKIRKYNRLVPNPLLQKGLVSGMNLHTAYDKWA